MTLGEAAREIGRLLREYAAPIAAGAVMAALSFAAFVALRTHENAQIQRLTELEGEYLASATAGALERQVLDLLDLARRWESVEAPDSAHWAADVEALARRNPLLRAFEWRDEVFQLRWSEPLAAREPGGDLDPQFDPDRVTAATVVAAHAAGSVAGSFVGPRGHRDVVFAAPLLRNGDRVGAISAITHVRDLIDAVAVAEIRRGFSIAVREGPYRVYGPLASVEGAEAERWWRSTPVQVGDLQWTIEYWPSADLFDRLRSYAPPWVLLGGLIVAAVLAGLVRSLELARRGVETPSTSSVATTSVPSV
jgi:hypothetical protein